MAVTSSIATEASKQVSPRLVRRRALITGAAGGMGRACARLLGAMYDLVLTDVAADPLERFVEELQREGYKIVAARAGDLGSDTLLEALTTDLRNELPIILIHTAGVSPSQADAQTIMRINLVATEKLLRSIEPVLRRESIAVLIASAAGHNTAGLPDVDALLANPLASNFMESIGKATEAAAAKGWHGGASWVSYSLSKRALIKMVERRATAWGRDGARIVSVSPGLILTPMGRRELEVSQIAAGMDELTPVGRAGTAMDVALAVRFLVSDEASFITGCDLKVDGGVAAMVSTSG